MKTNDFKNLMGMYDLEVQEIDQMVFVLKDGVTAATVSTTHQNCFSTHFLSMMAFGELERQEVVDLVWEYAGTDVEQRVDEKKTRLRLDVPLVKLPYYLYRNAHTGVTGITILENSDHADYQMEFTAEELLGLNRNGFKLEVVG